MLNMSYTKWSDAQDYPLLSTVTNVEEGIALRHTMENGVGKVRPSDGNSANDIFVGVAYHKWDTPSQMINVEEDLTVPSSSPYTITLERSPVGGTSAVLVKADDGTVFTVQSNSPGGAGVVQLSGDTLTFDSSDAGRGIARVVYRYDLTVKEAQRLTGDGVLGSVAPQFVVESVGVISTGWIYTSFFDPGAEWDAENINDIVAGANGYFQRGGTGAAVTGNVIHAPTRNMPFLGLYITE